MLPLSAGLIGSSPAIKIAHHIVTLLSTRNIETPALVLAEHRAGSQSRAPGPPSSGGSVPKMCPRSPNRL